MIDFFEYSNELLCVADSRGYFTRVNQAWTKALGWSAGELMGRPYVEFVHPDDITATQREATALVTDLHETIRFENRYRCRDGSYRWLAWQAVTEPETRNIIASARDVTEQKQQAEALREADDRFRTLATHAPVGIAQANAEGSIFYVNEKWCEVAGITVEEALGFAWKGFIHPDDFDQEIDRWQTAMRAGRDVPPHELRFLRGNGDVRWASVSVAMLKDASGEIVGQIATAADTTHRKKAELALKARQDLLRNLIEVQENEKQRLCNALHDGLLKFAVGALMSLEGCRRTEGRSDAGSIDPAAEETLDNNTFDANTSMLDRFDVVNAAVLESAIANLRKGIDEGRGTMRAIRTPVLDDSDLKDAIHDLIHQFTSPEMMVTYRGDSELGRFSEPTRTTIYRVAQEALMNARKYSGTDVVRIEARKTDGQLHVEIQDFGCGFDVAAARSRGFGLLGMTERVRLLGGECAIESEQNAGTRVCIRLPVSASEDA